MEYALRMENIHKRFPGVHALDSVTFEVEAGTVHALVGENGAGKSTLMKLLAGSLAKDEGTIEVYGEQAEFTGPAHAQRLGISMIHQELTVIPYRTVGENVLLGREPRRLGGLFIDYRELFRRTAELLGRIKLDISPSEVVSNLSVAQQQMVEVAKALAVNTRIIIMDEPTSSLTERETEVLFEVIAELKRQGITVIYISHRLTEVFRVSDYITVLRDGEAVHSCASSDITQAQVVEHMVGRQVGEMFPAHAAPRETQLLEVSGLTGGDFEDVSFTLNEGEILGFAGLVGAGRSETMRAIMGLDRVTGGSVTLRGETLELGSVRAMMHHGFAYLPEDRKSQALLLDMAVSDNIAISVLERLFRSGIIAQNRLERLSADYRDKLRIRTPSLSQLIRNLSGGNQQKVLIARCLALEPSVLILDEPTRGVDVGAKAEIHELIGTLAERGVGIIMISSELPEIVGISDRVVVMREGRVAAQLDKPDIQQSTIMRYAAGGAQ